MNGTLARVLAKRSPRAMQYRRAASFVPSALFALVAVPLVVGPRPLLAVLVTARAPPVVVVPRRRRGVPVVARAVMPVALTVSVSVAVSVAVAVAVSISVAVAVVAMAPVLSVASMLPLVSVPVPVPVVPLRGPVRRRSGGDSASHPSGG